MSGSVHEIRYINRVMVSAHLVPQHHPELKKKNRGIYYLPPTKCRYIYENMMREGVKQ